MKILNACLSCFYYEDYGYQENLLPIYQKFNGHEVFIAAPAQKLTNGKLEYVYEDYINDNDIPVFILKRDTSKYGIAVKRYLNFYSIIEMVEPDVVFIHGGQSASIVDAGKYKKRNPDIKIYIDNHADYYNSPVIKLTSKLNARLLLGRNLCRSWKYVDQYFGVTPWRCDFLRDVYGLPEGKISLLHMGGEDTYIVNRNKKEVQSIIKKRHSINENDFLIVTGGKIDKTKNIHLLMQAVRNHNNVKLIIFGSVNSNFQQEFDFSCNDNVEYIGWIDATKAYEYFLGADLAVFPGTHSVLWEQAVACKTPCIFKEWEGMKHVDIGGNCIFLKNDSKDEIENAILDLINHKDRYDKMQEVAMSDKSEQFLYSKIAEKSLGWIG